VASAGGWKGSPDSHNPLRTRLGNRMAAVVILGQDMKPNRPKFRSPTGESAHAEDTGGKVRPSSAQIAPRPRWLPPPCGHLPSVISSSDTCGIPGDRFALNHFMGEMFYPTPRRIPVLAQKGPRTRRSYPPLCASHRAARTDTVAARLCKSITSIFFTAARGSCNRRLPVPARQVAHFATSFARFWVFSDLLEQAQDQLQERRLLSWQ